MHFSTFLYIFVSFEYCLTDEFELHWFVVFVPGVYCFMNMLTAVVYNQFRGYFMVCIL